MDELPNAEPRTWHVAAVQLTAGGVLDLNFGADLDTPIAHPSHVAIAWLQELAQGGWKPEACAAYQVHLTDPDLVRWRVRVDCVPAFAAHEAVRMDA